MTDYSAVRLPLPATSMDPLDGLGLASEPLPDRLPAMLFLAALIHGILIIGVTFNPALSDEFAEAISLEVTIVAEPDQEIDEPERAEYLAQTSQLGGGNTREAVRPGAPLESAAPIDNRGDEDGSTLRNSTTHEAPADELLTSAGEQPNPFRTDPRNEPNPDGQRAVALDAGREHTLPLPREVHATLAIQDDEPRQLVISADTRESTIAAYLDNWKRRIEAVGEEYFPELGQIDGLIGSPTLEVSIDASGQLAEVTIVKSSGSKAIDQAALDILRRASPFDPFPEPVRAEYDSLRFAYKWLFQNDPGVPTAAANERS